MTCTELEALICDYVDGTLGAGQRAAVEQHLAECATCAELARDAAAAVRFMAQAAPVEPPDELVTKLLFQIPAKQASRGKQGSLGFLAGLLGPVLQPRFAMGMAMTILSFSLVGKFAGIPNRPLRPSDLNPVRVVSALDDRIHDVWDRAVKYYESLRVVYDIQTRLAEWSEEEQAGGETEASAATGGAAASGEPSNRSESR